jgi:hypothetical protein
VVPLRADHLERHRIVAYNKNSNMNGPIDLLRTQVLQGHGRERLAHPGDHLANA